MTKVKERAETRPVDVSALKRARLKHLVELKDGVPQDKCLCGYVWDVFRPKPEGEVCAECVTEARKRGWIR